MYPRKETVTATTDAGGDATVYSAPIEGRVLAIHYVKTDFDAGVDFDISGEDLGEELWDEDNVNASKTVYPRAQVHDTVGAGATLNGTQEMRDYIHLAGERVKIVVAQGGNAKTGTFHIIYG